MRTDFRLRYCGSFFAYPYQRVLLLVFVVGALFFMPPRDLDLSERLLTGSILMGPFILLWVWRRWPKLEIRYRYDGGIVVVSNRHKLEEYSALDTSLCVRRTTFVGQGLTRLGFIRDGHEVLSQVRFFGPRAEDQVDEFVLRWAELGGETTRHTRGVLTSWDSRKFDGV